METAAVFGYDVTTMEDVARRENIVPAEELRPPEGPGSDVERALEAGEAGKVKEAVEREAEDAIVEVKDFTRIAEDPEFPEVSKQTQAKADAIEAQIREGVIKTERAIDDVMLGPGTAEPPRPATKADRPEGGDVSIDDRRKAAAAFADIAAEAAKMRETPAEAPKIPDAKAETKKTADIDEFVGRFQGIVDEYKASEGKPSKLLARKLVKLMADAHPDKYGDDKNLKGLFSLMGRMNMALGGDARAWSTPRGVSFESDWQAWKSSYESSKTETAAAETAETTKEDVKEEAKAEAAAETPNPETLYVAFANVAADILRSKGALSYEMRAKLAELARRKSKLAGSTEAKGWEPYAESVKNLEDVVWRFSDHPVGMLQALDVYLTEHPDVAAKIGIAPGAVEALKKDTSREIAGNLDGMRDRLGDVASGLLKEKGGFTTDMAYRLNKLKDEIDMARMYEGEAMNDEGWKRLLASIEHFESIYRTTDHPVDRLKGLKVFADENPDIASKFGMSIETIDRAIRGVEGASETEGAPGAGAAPETTGPVRPEAEAQPAETRGRDTRKLDDQLEAAYASGDEAGMKLAIDDIEKAFAGQIADREKELQTLLATPTQERTPVVLARIEELQYANDIDRKTVERRKMQLDLVVLKREKKSVDDEVVRLQAELKPYEGAQEERLLAATAEEGRVLAAPGVDRRAELQTQLDAALAKQKELGENIGNLEGNIAALADAILQLTRLKERAQAAQRLAKEGEKAASPTAAAGAAFGTPSPGSITAQTGEKSMIAPAERGKGVSADEMIKAVGGALHDPGDAAAKAVGYVMDLKFLDKKKGGSKE